MCTRGNVSGRFHSSQNENDVNYKSSRCMKLLVFVLKRSLCWFSLNYVNKSTPFEIIRNKNAQKRHRVHVA